MSDDEIDLDRVINDPKYRREVLDYLNGREDGRGAGNVVELRPGSGKGRSDGDSGPSDSGGSDLPQG